MKAKLRVKNKLELTGCLKVGIRGYNRVGLYSTTETNLIGCTVKTKKDMIIIDATAELDSEINER